MRVSILKSTRALHGLGEGLSSPVPITVDLAINPIDQLPLDDFLVLVGDFVCLSCLFLLSLLSY